MFNAECITCGSDHQFDTEQEARDFAENHAHLFSVEITDEEGLLL